MNFIMIYFGVITLQVLQLIFAIIVIRRTLDLGLNDIKALGIFKEFVGTFIIHTFTYGLLIVIGGFYSIVIPTLCLIFFYIVRVFEFMRDMQLGVYEYDDVSKFYKQVTATMLMTFSPGVFISSFVIRDILACIMMAYGIFIATYFFYLICIRVRDGLAAS